jgi:hypothetical protein
VGENVGYVLCVCRPILLDGKKKRGRRNEVIEAVGVGREERNIPPSVQHPYNTEKIQQTGLTGSRRIDIVLFFLLFSLYSFSSLFLSPLILFSFLGTRLEKGGRRVLSAGCAARYMLGAIFFQQ